jgi:hypothetical protein
VTRYLYGASPADYTVNATTGAPTAGVTFNVYNNIGGTQITDLKAATGATLAEGSAITQITSNGVGAFPFYGPDGYSETLWIQGSTTWYGINPTAEGDLLSIIAADSETALAGVLDHESRLNTLEGTSGPIVDAGDISHSDLQDLVLNSVGVTLNPHTQYMLTSTATNTFYTKGEITNLLAAKSVPLTTMYQGGTLVAGVGSERNYVEFPCTIVAVRAVVTTAPTGASVIVDVNKNGTTIYGTQANRPTIAASSVTAVGGTASVTTLAAGDYLTFDIDQIGSTAAGANLKIQVWVRL